MIPLRLTNSLSSFLGASELSYNPSTQSVTAPISKEAYYRWEAHNSQCAYLSRLVYAPSEVFLRGIRFLDYAPDVCNDIVSQLEYSFYSRKSFDALFLSPDVPAQATIPHGKFFPRTGCAIFQHHNPSSAINAEPTLYVVFKGSSSMRDFMNDARINKVPFQQIQLLAGLNGTTHGGFYAHMRDEVNAIVDSVLSLSAGMKHIYITGHSLGGAMSTLFSLILARQMELRKITGGPLVHCVSFGAPNLFSDDARNTYNSYLLSGVLTLDRVTAETKGISGGLMKVVAGPSVIDVIILIPGAFFSHPGFNILKSEMYATSRTGRATNIDDTRAVFLGKANVVRRNGAGRDELPADPVFWNLFTQLPLDAGVPLDKRLSPYGQMKRYLNPAFVKFVLQDIQPSAADIQPSMTTQEEVAVDAMEEKALSAETAGIAPEPQVGGVFATTRSARNYKTTTLTQFPSRVNYQCYKRLSAGFCHAAYMGIGFLGGVRIPVIMYRDEMGKLQTRIVRKKEPTLITTFMANSAAMNPIGRYYAVANTIGGRKTRRNRRVRKH